MSTLVQSIGADPRTLVDLYLRLSIDREGKDSIERQEHDLRAWAAREGLTVRRVWTDAGKSGYIRGVRRPGFDSALEALTAGEVGTLAVWKLDRLSRQGAGQVGTALDEIDAAGGRLFFLKDSLDSTVPGHRMVIVVVSEQARAESANTSLRVSAKKDMQRLEGKWLGGPRPWGYELDDDRHLRPHPTEAPLVRELCDRVLSGETLADIARDWNRRGVPTRKGGEVWRTSTMSLAIRSPVLAGLQPETLTRGNKGYHEPRVTAPFRHPDTGETVSLMAEGFAPIVSEGERQRLLEELASRYTRWGRGQGVPRRLPESLLGGGMVRCATCGRSASSFGNAYRCRKRFVDRDPCEGPLNVAIRTLDRYVKREWAYGLATFDPDSPILAAVADRWLAKNDPAPIREREELTAQLADLRARMASADDDYYVRGTLDGERHARITSAIAERIASTQARIAELPKPEADLGALLDPELSLPAIEGADVLEARALLRLAIKRVVVKPAPYHGARFDPKERMKLIWVGEPDPYENAPA